MGNQNSSQKAALMLRMNGAPSNGSGPSCSFTRDVNAEISNHFKGSRKSEGNVLFLRADKEWDRGKLRSAFRLFRVAAEAGDRAAQLNVGYFYDNGIGVRRDQSAALYWYKRAYRRGDAIAATNIGTIWRDKHKPRRALSWFLRAVKLDDDSSNLEIAKYYLQNEHNLRKAKPYLDRVCKSDRVSEASAEEARRLLKDAKKN